MRVTADSKGVTRNCFKTKNFGRLSTQNMGVSGEVRRRTLRFESSTDHIYCQVFYHSVLRSNGVGQLRNLSDPAAVFFSVGFDQEVVSHRFDYISGSWRTAGKPSAGTNLRHTLAAG